MKNFFRRADNVLYFCALLVVFNGLYDFPLDYGDSQLRAIMAGILAAPILTLFINKYVRNMFDDLRGHINYGVLILFLYIILDIKHYSLGNLAIRAIIGSMIYCATAVTIYMFKKTSQPQET